MSKLQGKILTLPKMSGSVSTPKSLSGNVGAKTVNIGEDGATFIPSVSADGIISWTNDKDLPNPEPVNIKGVKGDKGDKGDRGLQGVQGIQGERGEQGQKGDKGDRGEQGIQGVQGLKGETGEQGQKGADGQPGKDGYTPVKGIDYFDGEKGDPGYTPIKGVDYLTPEDIEALRFQFMYKWPTYVESDGASYIDTGFIPDQNTRVVFNGVFTNKGATEYLFGARASSSSRRFTFYIASAKYTSGFYSQTKAFTAAQMYADPVVIDKNRGVVTINGVDIAEHTTTTDFTCPCAMTVFALNTNGTKSAYAKATLHSMQIYDNDVLVRDFIPCFNNCLGEYGLYDRLNDRFYRNLGTGTLTGA